MKKDTVLVLDKIRSLYNVGSMFRTADGLGVSKIYLCGYTGTPIRDKVQKVALGAEKAVDWEKCKQAWRVVDKLKIEGYQVVGLECGPAAKSLPEFKSRRRVAIVVGNEVDGLSQTIIKRCDAVVEIPMLGVKESYNVSVAAAMALYQIRFH